MVTTGLPLVRNAYADGERLTARDFTRDQDYHRAVQALRCRSLHTPGVAFGLDVTLADDQPHAVRVSPGMAIDSDGRQLVLGRSVLIDLAAEIATLLYVTVTADRRFAEWTVAPEGQGYARIHDEARVGITPVEPLAGGPVLTLARLTITPQRRLQPPDVAARTVCGLRAGHLSFPPPDGATPAPSLAIGHGDTPGADPLMLDAALTDLFGGMRVEGDLVVGPASAHDACLAVQTPPPVRGAGRIDSNGVYILGADAYDLASLSPGDALYAPVSSGPDAKAGEPYTVVAVAGQTVTVDRAPDPALVDAAYAIGRGDLLRIRPQPMTLALAVSTRGRVGVGGSAASGRPGDTAALSVRGGTLLLASGCGARFASDGIVAAAAQARSIALLSTRRLLKVSDVGALAFEVESGLGGLYLTAEGRVGIGTDAPPQRLSVAGTICADGGVIFADNSQQVTGVVAIPIGTVVIWWRPEGATAFMGAGFQLCDGSTITDPASPLVGLKTPNLNDVFIRGAVNFEEIGQSGGALTHTHAFVLPGHTHPMPHTHPVTGNTTTVNGLFGDEFTSDAASTSDHVHTIQGDSGAANPADTGTSSIMTPGATAPASSIPPYVAMLCAIRVR